MEDLKDIKKEKITYQRALEILDICRGIALVIIIAVIMLVAIL